MRLFLNLLRNDPALLNDEAVLKHFMAANNCGNAIAFRKELNNEFDYPKMAAFYKDQAPEILKGVPSSLTVRLPAFFLGQYDSAKGAFPFVERGQKKTTTLTDIEPANDIGACDAWGDFYGPRNGQGDPFFGQRLDYRINLKPISISELPMDEANAREFVEGLRTGGTRSVLLVVNLEILPTPTKSPQAAYNGRWLVNFDGRLNKITVYGAEQHQVLGVILP